MESYRELVGREVLRELAPGKSWLARDVGGRTVVLKLLEEDCLLEGKLHPSVRHRLERVRELPARWVANLHGAERDGDHGYLVWDFVEGRTLSELKSTEVDSQKLARDLVLAVQALHGRGIIHGAIHERNVAIDGFGRLWLIDVSPLLWTDEREDARAVAQLLQFWNAEHFSHVDSETVTMTQLEQLVRTQAGENADAEEPIAEPGIERRRSLIWAGIAIVLGLAIALGIFYALR